MINQPPLVVHVVYRFAVGGLENGLVNLINRMPPEEFRHKIIALTDCDAAFCRRLARKDVECVPLNKPPGQGWRVFRPVWRLLRAERPAIVHTRNLSALEMQIPAWAARVPVRIHGEHGRDVDDPDGRNWKYRLERRIIARAVTQFVAVSRDLEQYLVRAVGIEPRKVNWICNGVDEERFKPAAAGARTASPVEDGDTPVVIGTVGRLQAIKDQRTLVAATSRLLAAVPSRRGRFRVVLVGDGPMRATLEREIAERGLGDIVELLGERDDVAELMRGMDIFVLPSIAEGISNTILEAMASGLPVVATRVGGNGELVDDGRTGRLVPAGDAAAMAEALAAYLDSAELRRADGARARQRVEARFGLSAMVEAYRTLYRAALERAGIAV